MRAAHGIAVAACATALAIPAGLAGPAAGRSDAEPTGNLANGYRLFQTFSCGACHALRAAGPSADGQLGLDFNRIHVPYPVAVAVITSGLPAGPPVYPTLMVGYSRVMTASQIRDLATFVTEYSGGHKTCAACTAAAASP